MHKPSVGCSGNGLKLKHITIWKDRLSTEVKTWWKHTLTISAAPQNHRTSHVWPWSRQNDMLLIFLSVHLDMRRECSQHSSLSLPLISVTMTNFNLWACEAAVILSSSHRNSSILLMKTLSVNSDRSSAVVLNWSCCFRPSEQEVSKKSLDLPSFREATALLCDQSRKVLNDICSYLKEHYSSFAQFT